ncbi:MAG: type II toxin-antitoxin system PemK/MazF family toxin [Thermomicrobiales bacterium]|jgi:hypothetical protein
MARRIAALQGEIWNVDFDPIIGHEQGGCRPALILSQDAFNTFEWDRLDGRSRFRG